MKKKDDVHWGFTSWNEFFHRQIIEKRRPLSDPDNPKVIVSANDGHVYNFATQVRRYDEFWAKGQPYSLHDMLNGHYIDRFDGGDVIQSFLSGSDYHRFVAPVGGKVVHREVVKGLMFSNAESAGPDPHAGVLSQGYEVSVNTRGLLFIEGDGNVGMVCVIPIGITEVSSISFTDKVKVGERVEKGQELGMFSFGGSTLVMVFEPEQDRLLHVAPARGGRHQRRASRLDQLAGQGEGADRRREIALALGYPPERGVEWRS